MKNFKEIAVVGAGWYGVHVALTLQKSDNYRVTLFERNESLFSGISGLFGIRLHVGPHYPRSQATRRSCLYGFQEFAAEYPELIVSHNYSAYAVGTSDADGQPSKISADEFVKVCKESSRCEVISDPSAEGYNDLQVVVKLAEPSLFVGRELHGYFQKKLKAAGVNIVYNSNVTSIKKAPGGKITIKFIGETEKQFNYVINTTSFHSLTPSIERPIKLPFEVVYQPCLALVYEDLKPVSDKPFSFIVMDGWFPCMMPLVKYGAEQNKRQQNPNYILTHGLYTIMGSFPKVDEAKECLAAIDDEFIETKVKPNCEKEINRFWPKFKGRFKYVRWQGAVLAKTKSNTEFRSAVIFQENKTGVINVIPGKVSNIFDAANEVRNLIENKDIIHNEDGGFSYTKDGTLSDGLPEFEESITEANTCDLQTYQKLLSEKGKKQDADKEAEVRPEPESNFLSQRLSVDSGLKLLFIILSIAFLANECNGNPRGLIRAFLGLLMLVGGVIAVLGRSSSIFANQPYSLWHNDQDRRNDSSGPAKVLTKKSGR